MKSIHLSFLLFVQSSARCLSVELIFYLVSILLFKKNPTCSNCAKVCRYIQNTFQEWCSSWLFSYLMSSLLIYMLIFSGDSGKLELSCLLESKLLCINLGIQSEETELKLKPI